MSSLPIDSRTPPPPRSMSGCAWPTDTSRHAAAFASPARHARSPSMMAGNAFRGVPGRPYTTIVRERDPGRVEVAAQSRGVEDTDGPGGIGVVRSRQHPLRGPRIEPRLEVLDDVAEAGRRRSVGGDLPA